MRSQSWLQLYMYCVERSAFKISTCPLVWDYQNNHRTSKYEGGSCPMQEAMPHKLLFSRKGTFLYNILVLSINCSQISCHDNTGQGNKFLNKQKNCLLVCWTSTFIFLIQMLRLVTGFMPMARLFEPML